MPGVPTYARRMPIHLRAEPGDYAPAVLVPGDPNRATFIAEHFFDPGFRCVNSERGELGYTGTFQGKPLSVQSVGMGCPSAAIYYNELIQLGVTRLVRVGTAGGLARQLTMGDTVVAMSACPDDQMVFELTRGLRYAPTATWSLLERCVAASRASGANVHVGTIVSSALFYDTPDGKMAAWQQLGALAVEMEAAVLYTLAAMHDVEALAVMTVSDIIDLDGTDHVRISDDELRRGVERMMAVACDVATS